MIDVETLIAKFGLDQHPEGGYYKRTFAAGNHSFSSILFLLKKENFSAFHKIKSDEQWNWFLGDDIIIHEIDQRGNYIRTVLSNQPGKENFQYVVEGGNWFSSECSGMNGFTLCGCTVIPEFRFEDFELGDRHKLQSQFPAQTSLIEKFTR